MAQLFVSPGVFTKEVDQSFLAQGVAGIGAVVIGRTLKGPAFVPMIVNGYDAFAERFGATSTKMQMPYCAQNYLKNSAALTVVRVLGSSDGTNTTAGYSVGGIVGISDKTTAGSILAVIHHSGTNTVTITGVDANNFAIQVGTVFAATASFLTSSANYIEKVLNTDPTKYATYGHYLAQNFKYITAACTGAGDWSAIAISGATVGFARDFSGGETEWVKSQPVGGLDFNLFRFFTMSHGRATNDEIKVVIQNVKPSPSPLATPYGTFDVVVRAFGDTDARPSVLDSFVGCTMDPDSKSYIARKIGDSYEEFDTTQRKFVAHGTFPSKSKYIRVEVDTASNHPQEALPWGHRGYDKQVFNSGSVDDMPLTLSQIDRNGNVDANILWGLSFVSGGIDSRMRAFPDSAVVSVDGDFSLGFLSSSYDNNKKVWHYNAALAVADYHQPVYASASLYKFALPFIGGFDGWDLRVEDPTYLTNVADTTDIGVVSLQRAIDTVANPDAFDMNLLAIPAVHNLKVTDHARTMVNTRQDAMYVMDVTGSTVTEVVGNLKNRELDDNYSACYYPDLKLNDQNANKVVRVAPSVAVMGAIAFSDRIGQVFFAPAGLNRGGLGQFGIIDVVDRLTFQDRNDLYDNRINPIATFPNEGIVVFGQKTLQIKASALDRINVRRLLIFAKKTIASAAKYLLFEPNNPATWQRFVNMVNPILEKIRQDQGIERFKVVMDTSTNTTDLVDRNVMTGKIFLQPTKSAEFIDLSFVITNAGVSFGE
jgi:hypothetical protein